MSIQLFKIEDEILENFKYNLNFFKNLSIYKMYLKNKTFVIKILEKLNFLEL